MIPYSPLEIALRKRALQISHSRPGHGPVRVVYSTPVSDPLTAKCEFLTQQGMAAQIDRLQRRGGFSPYMRHAR